MKTYLAVMLIVFSLTSAILVGHFHSKYVSQNSARVSIATTLPLQQTDNLVRLGSNSTYTFFKRPTTDGTSPSENTNRNGTASSEDTNINNALTVLAVPVSQIVCISETNEKNGGKGCESIEQEPIALREEHKHLMASHEHEGYSNTVHNHEDYATADHKHEGVVTEGLLQERITKEMACGRGEKSQTSGFIWFNRDSEEFDDFSVNDTAMKGFIREVKNTQIEKWKVFGFASSDGHKTANHDLSERCANAVKQKLCSILNSSKPNQNCEKDIEINNSGENYPINGVANSRSVVIAVCVQQDEIP